MPPHSLISLNQGRHWFCFSIRNPFTDIILGHKICLCQNTRGAYLLIVVLKKMLLHWQNRISDF